MSLAARSVGPKKLTTALTRLSAADGRALALESVALEP